MSLTLLIPSCRIRSVCLWLSRRPAWQLIPLAAIGVRVVLGWSIPEWVPTPAGVLTVVLVAATSLGCRLHDELNEAGIPCRHCDAEIETDGEARA